MSSLFRSVLTEYIGKITNEDREILEKRIVKEEIRKVVFDEMKENVSPGCDGYSVIFYRHYWNEISDILVDLFNYIAKIGRMGIESRRSVIKLIPKIGKLLKLLENWRPISLTNTDYKIYMKVLTNRIKPLLPKLIDYEQTAYVPGRSIFTSIRNTLDFERYLTETGQEGILFNIDYRKCFDSVSRSFLYNIYLAHGFGEKFTKIQQTYT